MRQPAAWGDHRSAAGKSQTLGEGCMPGDMVAAGVAADVAAGVAPGAVPGEVVGGEGVFAKSRGVAGVAETPAVAAC